MSDTNPYEQPLDPPIIVEPTNAASAAVLWLHGLGADGSDFGPVVPELGPRVAGQVRFLFPHAPRQAVTVNGGMVMRAWYDIAAADLDKRADEAGVRASARLLDTWIDEQVATGISPSRIVLAGFSQGGVIALHAGLRRPEPLAGILALSTYLAAADSLEAEASALNANIPVFLGHGSRDPVVPLALCDRANEVLGAHGYAPELHTYPMEHSVSGEEIRDVRNWLERVLKL